MGLASALDERLVADLIQLSPILWRQSTLLVFLQQQRHSTLQLLRESELGDALQCFCVQITATI